MEPKPFWQSKTVWFNILALLVLIANAFGFVDFIPTEDVTELAGASIVIINLALRFITNQGVSFR